MATHDYVIENGSGSAVRADINNALQAIASVNSSATQPSAVVDKMLWHDTTGQVDALKQYNTNAFTGLRLFNPRIIDVGLLDTNGNEALGITATANAVNEITIANAATGNNPVVSATGGDSNINLTLTPKGTGSVFVPTGSTTNPSVSVSTDSNTGIYFPSADTMGFVEGGTGYQMGYRNVPSAGADKTTNYTLQLSDCGKLVSIGTSGGITVPNAVFSAGDIIYVYNNTGSPFTITRGTNAVLYQSGVNTDSPSLTVATRTMGAIQYVSSSTAVFFSGSQGEPFYEVEYLIVGGGGGGALSGGGAGGYVSAVTGETGCYCRNAGAGTGQNYVPTGKFLQVKINVDYNIQVGAGGSFGTRGGNSYVDTIVAIGGGAGGEDLNLYNQNFYGGSGGGGSSGAGSGVQPVYKNQFTPRQGNSGHLTAQLAGGGGGAGGPSTSTAGGAGMSSSIILVNNNPVTYAAGGSATTNADGGANTGNGASSDTATRNGGSGVIILKYPKALSITVTNSNVSPSGTYSNSTSGNLDNVIISSTGHGLVEGEPVILDFTSGSFSTTSRDGTYTVAQVIDANTFIVIVDAPTTSAASGNVTITQPTIAVTSSTPGQNDTHKTSTFTAGFGTFRFT